MIFRLYKQTKNDWNFTVIFEISMKILGHPAWTKYEDQFVVHFYHKKEAEVSVGGRSKIEPCQFTRIFLCVPRVMFLSEGDTGSV